MEEIWAKIRIRGVANTSEIRKESFPGPSRCRRRPCLLRVVLHWSTCNADSQRMFLARICRHVTLLNRFQILATRCSSANIAKNRSQRAVTLEWSFAQHRVIASWRCKLTSVTPPLNSLLNQRQREDCYINWRFIRLLENAAGKRLSTNRQNDESKADFSAHLHVR